MFSHPGDHGHFQPRKKYMCRFGYMTPLLQLYSQALTSGGVSTIQEGTNWSKHGNWRWRGDRICSQGSFGSLPSRAGDEPYSDLYLCHFIWKKVAGILKSTSTSCAPILPENQLRETFPFCMPGARAASGII